MIEQISHCPAELGQASVFFHTVIHTAGTGPSLEAISPWLLIGRLVTFQIWEDWAGGWASKQ